MRYFLETKDSLREATPQECHMIWWHLEVGEELHLDGFKVYDEDFKEPSTWTKNSIWSKCAILWKGYAKPGNEHIWPCALYDEYMASSEQGKKLFMDWIHGEYETPAEVQGLTGLQEARWVLNH